MKRVAGGAAVARAVVAVSLLVASCAPAQLGLPAIEVSATSPDGRVTALVRNHPGVDPPNQSLRIRLADGREIEVSKLSPDQDWSNQIVWSADSRRAAFLVQDSRVALVDASTGHLLGWTFLVDDRHGYPTAEVARELTLNADGSEASYRICPRAAADATCGPVTSRTLNSGDR